MSRRESPRVLVVGGGPAGSTAAALLAREGIGVTLLEREHFPRYHIGESVSPSCRAILEFSGVEPKIEARDYTVKRGVLLRWGAEKDWAVDWREMFGEDIRSWQVDRADFDEVLLEHAASAGVEVVQGANVKRVDFDGDGRAVSAQWEVAGERRTTSFDYVIDASGRAGVLSARQFRDRRSHDVFRNVAIWAYYQGGELLPRTPSGGIDVISSPQGWYWVIPLKDDVYSVGYVTHRDIFAKRRQDFGGLEEMFKAFVSESGTVSALVRNGVFQGPVRVEQDFSYVADSFCGPGYFIAGDAACFLDPLLSTGVHLALFSGLLAAASITAVWKGDITEAEAAAFYEKLYRNAYARLLTLVSGMYRKYQGRRQYFWLAQTLLRDGGPDQADTAFGAIVAGLSDLADATAVGGVAPALGLMRAAEQARERLAQNQGSVTQPAEQTTAQTTAPMRFDPSDLFDRPSGLHLVTTPGLSVKRR